MREWIIVKKTSRMESYIILPTTLQFYKDRGFTEVYTSTMVESTI